MKTVPLELRSKVKKYSILIAWWLIYENDKTMQDKLAEVLRRIEQTEDELRVSGLDQEVFDEVLKRAKRFVKLTVGEMTEPQLDLMIKLIFGQKTTPPKEGVKENEEIKYITYEHKKALWKGTNISIRSYVVEKAIKNGTGIRVKHNGQIMSLTPNQLETEGVHNRDNYHTAQMSAQGIKAGEKYYLIDYVFKPD